MKIKFAVREPDPRSLQGLQLLLAPVASDKRPLRGLAGACDWELCGELSKVVMEERMTGARGDRLLVRSAGRIGPEFVLLAGLGRFDLFGPGEIMPFFRGLAQVLEQAGVKQIGLAPHEFEGPGCARATVVSALLAGLLAGYNGPELELWLLEGREHAAEITLELARLADRFQGLEIAAID